MNKNYLNTITNGDCIEHLKNIEPESIDLFLCDIPYGINLDEWDVLHKNRNSALLGECGTTAVAAKKLNRNFIGFEIDATYTLLANQRIENVIKKNDTKAYSTKKIEKGNLNLFYKS